MVEYVLTLYVTGRTPRSQRAIANLRDLCETALRGHSRVQVIDVLESPQVAEEQKILATPTVVRERPLPHRRVIGDLSDREKLLAALELRPAEEGDGEAAGATS